MKTSEILQSVLAVGKYLESNLISLSKPSTRSVLFAFRMHHASAIMMFS